MCEALRRATETARVDLWLASSKCAPHLVPAPANLLAIDHALELSTGLRARLERVWRAS
jgi:hypothetical protein